MREEHPGGVAQRAPGQRRRVAKRLRLVTIDAHVEQFAGAAFNALPTPLASAYSSITAMRPLSIWTKPCDVGWPRVGRSSTRFAS